MVISGSYFTQAVGKPPTVFPVALSVPPAKATTQFRVPEAPLIVGMSVPVPLRAMEVKP